MSRWGNRLSSCATTATPLVSAWAVLRRLVSAPIRRRVPVSGRTAPVMILTSVDLPAPFSPSRAWTLPGRTAKSTPFSALTPP